MSEKTPEQKKYIRMIEAIIDLGTEFNGNADLQSHYKDDVKRHKQLVNSDKQYAKTFNAYRKRLDKDGEITIALMTVSHNFEHAKTSLARTYNGFKFVGLIAQQIPASIIQRRREDKLARIALSLS